jgi:hypothetical protein
LTTDESKEDCRTVVISGYPKSFKEDDLKNLIGVKFIKSIKMGLNKAEITFKTRNFAQ